MYSTQGDPKHIPNILKF